MKKILLIIFLCLLIGCSQIYNREQLSGKYVANHPYGKDYLFLNIDGTYSYSFTDKNGETTTNENKWQLEHINKKTVLTFLHFDFALPDYGTDSAGYWVVEVKKSFAGNYRLIIDPDLNYYYEKVK